MKVIDGLFGSFVPYLELALGIGLVIAALLGVWWTFVSAKHKKMKADWPDYDR